MLWWTHGHWERSRGADRSQGGRTEGLAGAGWGGGCGRLSGGNITEGDFRLVNEWNSGYTGDSELGRTRGHRYYPLLNPHLLRRECGQGSIPSTWIPAHTLLPAQAPGQTFSRGLALGRWWTQALVLVSQQAQDPCPWWALELAMSSSEGHTVNSSPLFTSTHATNLPTANPPPPRTISVLGKKQKQHMLVRYVFKHGSWFVLV